MIVYLKQFHYIDLSANQNLFITGRVIPKTQKMVLDAALLNTQHYKMWVKGKVEQSREWSSARLYISML